MANEKKYKQTKTLDEIDHGIKNILRQVTFEEPTPGKLSEIKGLLSAWAEECTNDEIFVLSNGIRYDEELSSFVIPIRIETKDEMHQILYKVRATVDVQSFRRLDIRNPAWPTSNEPDGMIPQ